MSLLYKVDVPCAVSSLSLSEDGTLLAGCEDGTVRRYNQSSTKVSQAISSLGAEISSICCSQARGQQPAEWFVAAGSTICRFPQNVDKMILARKDACGLFQLRQEEGEEEDVLNEINLSHDRKYLAFGTDNGVAGVFELSTGQIHKMRTQHTSICGSVKFIPDRPSELVSGGYDCKLLHHDFQQRTPLSDFDLAQSSPSNTSDEPSLQLSPPFVLSTAISSTGMFAATTANGLAFVGAGGEKCPLGPAKSKKRKRRWEGLKETEGKWVKVAEGPVVAVAFLDPHQLVTCTLLGELKQFTVDHRDAQAENDTTIECRTRWTSHTENIAKVNALVIGGHTMAIGGLTQDGKGVVEVWDVSTEAIDRRTTA